MNKVLQTRQGAPHGNCHAACLASIFELPLESIPDPRWPEDVPWQEAQDGPEQTDRGRRARDERYEIWQAWLAQRGLTSLGFPAGPWVPKGYALGSVVNPRGVPHYVVCLDGRPVWDPNPRQDSYDREIGLFEYFIALDVAKGVPAVERNPMESPQPHEGAQVFHGQDVARLSVAVRKLRLSDDLALEVRADFDALQERLDRGVLAHVRAKRVHDMPDPVRRG